MIKVILEGRNKFTYVPTCICTVALTSNLTVKNLKCSNTTCKMSSANNYDPSLLQIQKSVLGIM